MHNEGLFIRKRICLQNFFIIIFFLCDQDKGVALDNEKEVEWDPDVFLLSGAQHLF